MLAEPRRNRIRDYPVLSSRVEHPQAANDVLDAVLAHPAVVETSHDVGGVVVVAWIHVGAVATLEAANLTRCYDSGVSTMPALCYYSKNTIFHLDRMP